MPSVRVRAAHPLSSINVAATVKRDDELSDPLFRGHLCGTLAGEAVILELTEAPSFQVGERLVIQTNLQGHAIGFVASVIGTAEKPTPHLYLSFPGDYEELELRKAARVPALIPVRIELGDEPRLLENGGAGEGLLINVSRSGCALSSLKAYGPNETITLCLTLPGRPGEYRLGVTVVNRHDTPSLHVHGGRFLPGLKMGESLGALQDWVARQQSLWPGPGTPTPRGG